MDTVAAAIENFTLLLYILYAFEIVVLPAAIFEFKRLIDVDISLFILLNKSQTD